MSREERRSAIEAALSTFGAVLSHHLRRGIKEEPLSSSWRVRLVDAVTLARREALSLEGESFVDIDLLEDVLRAPSQIAGEGADVR